MYEPLFCECCGKSIAELRKEIEENGVLVREGGSQMDNTGNMVFKPTNDLPIREFPLKDNKAHGAIEIYKKPEIDALS